jgi:hypothetical protein
MKDEDFVTFEFMINYLFITILIIDIKLIAKFENALTKLSNKIRIFS